MRRFSASLFFPQSSPNVNIFECFFSTFVIGCRTKYDNIYKFIMFFTFKSFIVLSTYFTRSNKLEIKKKSLFVVYVKYPSVPFTDQPKFCEYIDKIDADETEEQDKSQEGVQIKIRSRSQPLQVFPKKCSNSS